MSVSAVNYYDWRMIIPPTPPLNPPFIPCPPCRPAPPPSPAPARTPRGSTPPAAPPAPWRPPTRTPVWMEVCVGRCMYINKIRPDPIRSSYACMHAGILRCRCVYRCIQTSNKIRTERHHHHPSPPPTHKTYLRHSLLELLLPRRHLLRIRLPPQGVQRRVELHAVRAHHLADGRLAVG